MGSGDSGDKPWTGNQWPQASFCERHGVASRWKNTKARQKRSGFLSFCGTVPREHLETVREAGTRLSLACPGTPRTRAPPSQEAGPAPPLRQHLGDQMTGCCQVAAGEGVSGGMVLSSPQLQGQSTTRKSVELQQVGGPGPEAAEATS